MIKIFVHLIDAYTLLMFVWVLSSWIPALRSHRVAYYIGRLCEPVLSPIRRILPPMGGIDWSPMVAIFLLQMLKRALF